MPPTTREKKNTKSSWLFISAQSAIAGYSAATARERRSAAPWNAYIWRGEYIPIGKIAKTSAVGWCLCPHRCSGTWRRKRSFTICAGTGSKKSSCRAGAKIPPKTGSSISSASETCSGGVPSSASKAAIRGGKSFRALRWISSGSTRNRPRKFTRSAVCASSIVGGTFSAP